MSYLRARYAVYFSDPALPADLLHCRVSRLRDGRALAARLNQQLMESARGRLRGLPLYYASSVMRLEECGHDNEE